MKLTKPQLEALVKKASEEILERKKKFFDETLLSPEIDPLLKKLDDEYESMSDEMKKFLGRYGQILSKPSTFSNAREKACFSLWMTPINPHFYDRDDISHEIAFLSIKADDLDHLKLLMQEVIENHVKEKKHNKPLYEMLS